MCGEGAHVFICSIIISLDQQMMTKIADWRDAQQHNNIQTKMTEVFGEGYVYSGSTAGKVHGKKFLEKFLQC